MLYWNNYLRRAVLPDCLVHDDTIEEIVLFNSRSVVHMFKFNDLIIPELVSILYNKTHNYFVMIHKENRVILREDNVSISHDRIRYLPHTTIHNYPNERLINTLNELHNNASNDQFIAHPVIEQWLETRNVLLK